MFIWGMWLFAVASLAGGLAQSDIWLIVARAVQGLGAALISPAALAIVTTTFREGAERNKALGVWGAVAGSGGAAGRAARRGPHRGLGWEWVLFVNMPIGIAAALLAPRLLGESRDRSRGSFDIAGAVSVTAGLALLVYTLVDAERRRLGLDADARARRGVGGAAGAVRRIESRTRHPLVPFSIFRLRTLRGANVVGLLLGMSLFSMFFFISLYMQQVLGYEPLKAGLAYLPLAGRSSCPGAASALVTRIGFKPTLIAGMLFDRRRPRLVRAGERAGRDLRRRRPVPVAARGDRPRARVRADDDRGGHRHRRPDEAGLASGLINTSQQVGGALGLAVLAAVATATTDDAIASGERNPAGVADRGLPGRLPGRRRHGPAGALLAAT